MKRGGKEQGSRQGRTQNSLDKINCHILNLLQEDCRMPLTKIAKDVHLSIDAVRKRILKMQMQGLFYPKIQIRPRKLGFSHIADVKIKLHKYTKEQLHEFVEYLTHHPRVGEIFSISGQWDFSVVIIARNNEELGALSEEIRSTFHAIINEWSESITTCAYKFEKYDLLTLMGHVKNEEKQFPVKDGVVSLGGSL